MDEQWGKKEKESFSYSPQACLNSALSHMISLSSSDWSCGTWFCARSTNARTAYSSGKTPLFPLYCPHFNLQIKCPVPIPSRTSASARPPSWRQWAQAGQSPVSNHPAGWYFNHHLGARYIIVGGQLFIMGNWDKLADQLISAHVYIAVNHWDFFAYCYVYHHWKISEYYFFLTKYLKFLYFCSWSLKQNVALSQLIEKQICALVSSLVFNNQFFLPAERIIVPLRNNEICFNEKKTLCRNVILWEAAFIDTFLVT